MAQGRAPAFSVSVVCLLLTGGASAKTKFGLALGARQLSYQEVVTPPLKSTQSGGMPDVEAYSEQETESHRWFAKERVQYIWGRLRYDGSSQPPNPVPVSSNNDHTFWVLEGIVGHRLFGVSSNSEVFLYGGASYRLWYRNLDNPNEVYHLLTIPVGLSLRPVRSHFLAFGLDVSVRPMISGHVDVSFPASTGYDAMTVPVTAAVGFRAEMPIQILGGEAAGVKLVPWAEYSNIGQGAAVPLTSSGQPVLLNGQALGASEPASHTFQYGVQLAVEFGL